MARQNIPRRESQAKIVRKGRWDWSCHIAEVEARCQDITGQLQLHEDIQITRDGLMFMRELAGK